MSSITVIADDDSGASIVVGIPIPVGAGEANTLIDAGQNAHESLVATPSKVIEALQVQGLRAGTGITLTPNVPDQVIEISSSVGSPGDVTGPGSSTLNAPAVYADTTGKLLKDPDTAFDMAGQDIGNVGTVDGRTVSTDGATLDAHVADMVNPHGVTAVQAGADPTGTAATVQTNLDTHTSDLANPHVVTAVQAGADPTGTAAAAIVTHDAAFDHTNIPTTDEKAALAGTGTPTGGNPYVNDDDSRLTDSRVPTGTAGGDLAGTYPNPTVPHILATSNPHGVTIGQVGGIPAAEKGAPNGVAELDGSGTVPLAQLPERAKSKVDQVADAAARLALSANEGDVAEQLDTGEFYHFDGSGWLLVPGANTVTSTGPVADNEVAVYDGTTAQALKGADAAVSFAGQAIVSVGNVDGRDVSADGTKLDGIEAGAKDDQTITAGVGLTGGGTGDVALAADFGDSAGEVIEGTNTRMLSQAENDAAQGTDGVPSNANRFVTDSDARLTDARAPTSHAASHQDGGSDEISTTVAAAGAIPKAALSGALAAGWVDDITHGARGGGTQHAVAGGSAGFMSAADKTKLDGIDVGAEANQQINANTGLTGGGSGDTVNLAADIGTGVGQVAAGNDTRIPSQDENDALVGTDGLPSTGNPYVTDSDPRNTDGRVPSGAAGGDLAGFYPSPSVVAASETTAGKIEIATQTEVNTGTDDTKAVTPLKLATLGTPTHAVGGAAHTASTLAVFNTKISDATLDDAGAARTPTTHGLAAIEHSGSTLAMLNTKVTDATLIDTGDTRIPTQDENNALVGTDGSPAVGNRYVTDSDPRNTDARTPTTHAIGGSEHSASTLAAFNLKISDATLIDTVDTRIPTQGENDALVGTDGTPATANPFVTDSDPRNTDARTPVAHAASHAPGGSDALATASAGAILIGDAAAEGVSANFARADHTHSLAAPAAPANITKAAASAGAATAAARADHKHDIDTAAPTTAISTDTTNGEGVATSLARSDHSHEVNVSNTQVTSVVNFTTSSVTDVLITGMSITPGAGTYLAMFSGQMGGSGGAKDGIYSLYSNGVQIAHTERVVNDIREKFGSTQAIVTVAAAQAIEARGRGLNTLIADERSLILVRLA